MNNIVSIAKEYIGTDSVKVPYLYSNLVSYDENNPHTKFWIEKDDNNNVIGICLLYHTCLHFYTKDISYNGNLLWTILSKYNVDIVMLPGYLEMYLNKFSSDEWSFIYDYIVSHPKTKFNQDYYSLEVKSKKEIIEISQLLLKDPLYSKIYTQDELSVQLIERWEAGFGKIFQYKINDKIVGCLAITGENDKFIFYGCLMVDPAHRRIGIAGELVKAAVSYAFDINKECLCFIGIDNKTSIAMHEKCDKPIIIGKIIKCLRKK